VYVVEAAGGARYVGEVAVDSAAAPRITATRLRPLP
jgi:hypothetical protein